MTPAACDLRAAVAELARLYPPPPALTDPLALIVWDNVGYLVDDVRRAALFEAFRDRVGLDATAIAHAPTDVLLDLARRGGMRPETRAQRLRSIGELTLAHAGGDLKAALRTLPPAKARRLLKLYPGIGEPGADRILLFSGVEARPALESNVLRVLGRLGLFADQPSYDRNYKAAVAVLAAQGRPDRDWLMAAYSVLRAHGQSLCRRAAPDCLACPLDPVCAHQTMRSV